MPKKANASENLEATVNEAEVGAINTVETAEAPASETTETADATQTAATTDAAETAATTDAAETTATTDAAETAGDASELPTAKKEKKSVKSKKKAPADELTATPVKAGVKHATLADNVAPVKKLSPERKEQLREAYARSEARDKRAEEKVKNIAANEQLMTAYQTGKMCEGTIVSVESIGDEVYSIVLYSGTKVYIPFYEMFPDTPIDASDVSDEQRRKKDIIERKRQLTLKNLLANIKFVITDIKTNGKKEYFVIGSRRKANERLVAFWYGFKPGQEELSEGGKLHVGDVVDNADIIAVGTHSLLVNICGVDTLIPTYDLTFRYAPDLAEFYHAGEKISLKVTNIEVVGGRVKVSANGKDAEFVKAQEKIKMVNKDSCYVGVITGIHDRQEFTMIHLFLEGIEIPAVANSLNVASMSRVPRIGDKVVFTAIGLTKTGYVHGKILRIC